MSFDSVVMLTWSDWRTEPRSNRYHFATRFARHWPVYFVQPDGIGQDVVFEPVEGHDITLVRVASDYGPAQAARLAAALAERGARRPLVWTYNGFFADAIPRLNPVVSVYHATEDYLAPDSELLAVDTHVAEIVQRALSHVDFVVAVSDGVAGSYRNFGRTRRPVIVLPNGCDYQFWHDSGASNYQAPRDGAKVALYQGGINVRLDYELLDDLARRLPDWQFWFCGKSVHGGADWAALQTLPNVRSFGQVAPEALAKLAKQALVGLIPFKQDGLMRRSLPLKAYEYLACGLPVATIPIDALAGNDELFAVAEDADGFAAAITALAPTRSDPAALEKRLTAARGASYDSNFDQLLTHLGKTAERKRRSAPMLNVLILYDEGSTHVGTILEHLDAFRKYSRNKIAYYPATSLDQPGSSASLPFDVYDALIVHYSVRVSLEWHLSPEIARRIAAYHGPKLLFIQDEYDTTETARAWIERLGITAVYTNVPPDSVDKIYPEARFPNVDFIPTLTGYVPEDPSIDAFALPADQRSMLIGYRGRQLPHHYGALGYEKYRIGVDVRAHAERHGLPTDIEVYDTRRIYGSDWYRFMGSVRATLGTESGSNVFDDDGSLLALSKQHAQMPFPEFADAFLQGRENLVRMNQVSPKIFEAIRLRTALILYEGEYSGVVQPDRHFIPLKKDCSNITEVFARLDDVAAIESMTELAYRDVIESGRYAYRAFVADVDAYLDLQAAGRRRARIISVPVLASHGPRNHDLVLLAEISSPITDTPTKEPAIAYCAEGNHDVMLPAEISSLITDTPIGPDFDRGQMRAIGEAVVEARPEPRVPALKARAARKFWRLLPMQVRQASLSRMRAYVSGEGSDRKVGPRLVRSVWRRLWLALQPKG